MLTDQILYANLNFEFWLSISLHLKMFTSFCLISYRLNDYQFNKIWFKHKVQQCITLIFRWPKLFALLLYTPLSLLTN